MVIDFIGRSFLAEYRPIIREFRCVLGVDQHWRYRRLPVLCARAIHRM
jgi:hypothetical protein